MNPDRTPKTRLVWPTLQVKWHVEVNWASQSIHGMLVVFFALYTLSVCFCSVLVRPPDIVCRRTYILPGFLSFFLLSFFRQLISELAERNSTIFGQMVGSKCNLKMHVRNLGYPIPLQTGAQKPPFRTTSQLNGNFSSLYLRNDTWYRQPGKCVNNYKGSATSSQNDMHFGPQTASNWKWVFTHPP